MCSGQWGRTPLHSACNKGQINEVKYLVEDVKVEPSYRDEHDATPLHMASVCGQLSVVRLLVEDYLCDPTVRDKNGETSADYAQTQGHTHITSYLSSIEKIVSTDLRRALVAQLKPYTRKARPTGTVLGSGTYGSVIELTSAGETVAGKVFKTSSTTRLQAVTDRVCGELIMMTQLHHPNIVQSKGLCFLLDQRLPVLLMERLMSSLHAYVLDPHNANLPLERKVSILRDIASGLAYLHRHTPAIIHRDLTAKNVLLDSELTAKIADFGNSRIIDLDPEASPETFTFLPGTLEYMPPEAYRGSAKYDPSLDVFSFGHLALFTITQAPARPLLPHTYTDSTGELRTRSEVKRREGFVEKTEQLLSENHSLVAVMKQCLHNNPALRPYTGELLTRLQEMLTTGGDDRSTDQETSQPQRPPASLFSTPADTHSQGQGRGPGKADSETGNSHTEERSSTAGGDTACIRGSHIAARTSVVVVPGKALQYDWKKHGFKVHIPAEALQQSSAPLTMHIQASVSGKFQLPNNLQLVSVVYWISFPKKFSKPVRVTVQHCACLEYPDTLASLSFITAKCTQATLPYNFKRLQNGVFTRDSQYGSIELDHFSAVAVAGINKEYVISTHYVPQRTATTWLTHFAITSKLDINLLKISEHYAIRRAEEGPQEVVIITSDRVGLKIPADGVNIEDIQWSLTPLTYPVLRKSIVDGYSPGQAIPSIQLQLRWVGTVPPPQNLSHRIDIVGVAEPDQFLRITREPHTQERSSTAGGDTEDHSSSTGQSSETGEGVTAQDGGGHGDGHSACGDKRHAPSSLSSPPPANRPLSSQAERPKLQRLFCFQTKSGESINIMQRVGTQYRFLGVILLEDDDGAIVNQITSQYHLNADNITLEILMRWIQGKGKQPVTWKTLTNALAAIGLTELAKSILESL